MARPRSRMRGGILLEALVAGVVGSVGLAVMVQAHAPLVHHSMQVHARTQAGWIARATLEALAEHTSVAPTALPLTHVEHRGVAFEVERVRVVDARHPSVQHLSATVTWRDARGASHRLRITTMRHVDAPDRTAALLLGRATSGILASHD